MPRFLFWVFWLCCALGSGVLAAPTAYLISNVGNPVAKNPQRGDVVLTSINNRGQIVGYAADGTPGVQEPFFRGSEFGGAPVLIPQLRGPVGRGYNINDSGEIVGVTRINPDGRLHAYRMRLGSDGIFTFPKDLGTLGGSNSIAYTNNRFGDAVGASETAEVPPNTHACWWHDGVIADLGTLGGSKSTADGINNSGDIVGFSLLSGDQTLRGFIWHSGRIRALLGLSPTYSRAFMINDRGDISGTTQMPRGTNYHACIWFHGDVCVDMGTLGGATSAGAHLANDGTMVGKSMYPGGGTNYHACRWDPDGTIRDLNDMIPGDSGWVLESALVINDYGQIIGHGFDHGVPSGFLLTPAPVALSIRREKDDLIFEWPAYAQAWSLVALDPSVGGYRHLELPPPTQSTNAVGVRLSQRWRIGADALGEFLLQYR